MAAKTIGNLVTEARILLQDTVTPYRYSDTNLYLNLNSCFGEARRIRPDLFFSLGYGNPLPSYDSSNANTPFPLSEMWYMPFVLYIVGMTEAQDDEFTEDNRAMTFLSAFTSKLRTAV
jgi:hypothetical protein